MIKRSGRLLLMAMCVLLAVLVLGVRDWGVVSATVDSGCVIPPSGPWPDCATGGSTPTPPPPDAGDCVIPPSGPWPDCATGGSAPAASPVLNSFTANKTWVLPDDMVTLSWSVSNAQSVEIRPINHVTNGFALLGLSPTASIDFDMGMVCDNDGEFTFAIAALDQAGQFTQLGTLEIATVAFDWFFELTDGTLPAHIPCNMSERTFAAEQSFERGKMVWIGDTNKIYVLVNATGNTPALWSDYTDTFVEGDMETDPSIVPPAGLLQPKRGFGKVWRENPHVRAALGWATDHEVGFATLMQRYDSCIAASCEGALYVLDSSDQSVLNIRYSASTTHARQWSLHAIR
ncbi:MAG TPA: hypothetical protein ENJ56_00210 [Anaerolineae bacterium]|nr:hypothetical protein [Anaerolineae bacterium]